MTRFIQRILLLFGSMAMTLAPAQADMQAVQLGKISYTGSACPTNSVSAYLDTRTAKLHIQFRDYIVEARGRNQHIKKTCQIAVPIHVPSGVSISLVDARYHGKVSLPTGSQARIMNAFSFSGRRGMRFKTDFRGPNSNGYSLHDPLSSFAGVWSPCGQDTVLRITTSTRIKTKTSNSKSHADSQQGFVTQLRYRSCQ